MKLRLTVIIMLVFLVLESCAPGTPAPPSVQSGPLDPKDTVTPTPTSTYTPVPISPPTIPPDVAVVTQNAYCYNGPNESYQKAAIAPAGMVVHVLGVNSDDENWFMIQEKSIGRCWMNINVLSYALDTHNIQTLMTAFTTEPSRCRIGPGSGYREYAYIPRGWRIVINAKNDLNAGWVLVTPNNSTTQCWVARRLFTEFDYYSLPTVDPFDMVVNVPQATSPVYGNGGNGNGNGGNGNGGNGNGGNGNGGNGNGGNGNNGNGNGGNNPTSTLAPNTPNPPTPIPPTPIPPTATLCWPPGHCK